MMTPETYRNRRIVLAQRVGHPILLFAGLEQPHCQFLQDSNFYYFTGLTEPGFACLIMPDGQSTLFVPCYAELRAKWMGTESRYDDAYAKKYGFERLEQLGAVCSGYSMSLFDRAEVWSNLGAKLEELVGAERRLATVFEHALWLRMQLLVPELTQRTVSCAAGIAAMRRAKDRDEIEPLFRAGAVTALAQQAAVWALGDGIAEADVLAGMRYVFTQEGAREAFPTIIAGGERATILHYAEASGTLKNGECVIIDSGAQVDHYCADVTRTYPVSGSFSKRQREVYEAVLTTQLTLAEEIKPGWWIRNDDEPQLSLHHRAKELLAQHGLAEYFTHGIGHFLGLDVHDVGDRTLPLAEGDVITIEPGVYLPDEGLGVRIEDDFWVVKNGAVCITDDLPCEASEVEDFVKSSRELPRSKGKS
ncbi:MAG: aminopeptidase P N-terminal domain-containing protein [Candidatus Dependentiae bacterium]|nr:aminopeptidase P N-terminal domain-containing protein [Candidatus Dependentiae bacterium]